MRGQSSSDSPLPPLLFQRLTDDDGIEEIVGRVVQGILVQAGVLGDPPPSTQKFWQHLAEGKISTP